jgi:spore coat protein U-like protein
MPLSMAAQLGRRLMALLGTFLMCHTLIAFVTAGAFLAATRSAHAADCTISNQGTQTFTYTAATLGSAAQINFASVDTCTAGDDGKAICISAEFTPTVASGSNTMTLQMGFNDTTYSESVSNMLDNGHVYGPNGPLHTTGASTQDITVTATIPAGQASSMPVGTYTQTIPMYFDMTENSCGTYGNGGYDAVYGYYTVNYVIPSVCTLLTTPTINFGTLSSIGPTTSAITASGTISAQCNGPYTVYIGDGNDRVAPGSGNRQMANGSALLPYQLYKDSGLTQIWDNTGGPTTLGGSGGSSGTGTGATITLPVYGSIPSGITLPSTTGLYQDTVVVTVAY